MSEATEAVRLRMAGGWQHSQDRDHPAGGVLARASVENTLGVPPQQVKAKISAGIGRGSRRRVRHPIAPCNALSIAASSTGPSKGFWKNSVLPCLSTFPSLAKSRLPEIR